MLLTSSVHVLSLQQLLVYKYISEGISSPSFEQVWQRGFAHPIHCVWYGDVTHDGLSELVVVSMGGVHILQVHSHAVRN